MIGPLLITGWLSVFAADSGSTHWALAHCPPGFSCRESTIVGAPLVRDSVLATEAAVGVYFWRRYEADHPKLLRTLFVAGIVLHGAATVHNVQTIRKAGR